MATFRQRCGDHGYAALVAYEPYMPINAKGFVNHLAREPDRNMTASQEDWASELLTRAVLQQRLNNGQCALPPTLDDPDNLYELVSS